MLISVLDSVLVYSWSLYSSFLTEGGDLAGPRLAPCWDLAGAWPGPRRDLPGPRQQPLGIPVSPARFIRLESIGNPGITNYQFNTKNNKNAMLCCKNPEAVICTFYYFLCLFCVRLLLYIVFFFATRLTVRCYGPIYFYYILMLIFDVLVKSFVLAEVKATTFTF